MKVRVQISSPAPDSIQERVFEKLKKFCYNIYVRRKEKKRNENYRPIQQMFNH